MQGSSGTSGADGDFGGVTFKYQWSTSTTVSGPGAGKLKLNNSTANVSKLSIDILDQDGSAITDFLATIDDSTNTIKGHFKISKEVYAGDFLLFTAIDALTQNTGFFVVDATLVSSSITH